MLLLGLSSNLGESYAQSNAEIQPHTDEGNYACHGSASFSGVAYGGNADAGHDCPLLPGDGP